jgi:RNA polymerase sigma factor (sigma-70 family)
MAPAASKPYDYNLSDWGEEELLLLYRECDHKPARQELILRLREWVERLVASHARRARLPDQDLPDAKQNGLLVMVEALEEYDTARWCRRDACSLRTWLRCRLESRDRNFVRGRRRYERRLDRSAEVADLLDGKARADADGAPAHIAEAREATARLGGALHALDELNRTVMELRLEGHTCRAIAAALRLSEDQVKRLRRKALGELSLRLRELRAQSWAG